MKLTAWKQEAVILIGQPTEVRLRFGAVPSVRQSVRHLKLLAVGRESTGCRKFVKIHRYFYVRSHALEEGVNSGFGFVNGRSDRAQTMSNIHFHAEQS